MKFTLVLVQLGAAAVHDEQEHEAKCSLLIARCLLLFSASDKLQIFVLKLKV